MKLFSFPKSRRLISNSQFRAVLTSGRRRSDGLLVLYTAQNDCGYPRLGVSIGRSHGNAVARNRLKRVLREVFRQNQQQIPAGFDYVLIARPAAKKRNRSRGKTRGPQNETRDSRHKTRKPPTLEQIKASFLALAKSGNGGPRTDDGNQASDV